MSAYVIVQYTLKNADKMAEYGAAAGPTVAKHGGELAYRGPSSTVFGDSKHENMVIVKFDSKKAAEDWYNSPEYQAIIPTRTEGIDAVFTIAGE